MNQETGRWIYEGIGMSVAPVFLVQIQNVQMCKKALFSNCRLCRANVCCAWLVRIMSIYMTCFSPCALRFITSSAIRKDRWEIAAQSVTGALNAHSQCQQPWHPIHSNSTGERALTYHVRVVLLVHSIYQFSGCPPSNAQIAQTLTQKSNRKIVQLQEGDTRPASIKAPAMNSQHHAVQISLTAGERPRHRPCASHIAGITKKLTTCIHQNEVPAFDDLWQQQHHLQCSSNKHGKSPRACPMQSYESGTHTERLIFGELRSGVDLSQCFTEKVQ